MAFSNWQFFIDVGGTFTDVVARRPDGELVTHKLLSSGVVRGVVEHGSTPTCIQDSRRIDDPENFWTGYHITLLAAGDESGIAGCGSSRDPLAAAGPKRSRARVTEFDCDSGQLILETPLRTDQPADHRPPRPRKLDWAAEGEPYELTGGEEAPLLAIRYLMGIGLHDSIGPVDVRLGTTRATNALLERKGASVAFVTTKGFGDILKIGNQDRPKLFELNIRKRDELAACVVEIDERISAGGEVLRKPDDKEVRAKLEQIRAAGIEAVAICLLHAHTNPVHEKLVAAVAESVGFGDISVSSRVARLERMVPRGDTTVVDAYLSGVLRDYWAALRRSMPEARLKLMTSSGGLVAATQTAGSSRGGSTPPATSFILSGPAGGVVGCAHTARQAGFSKTIGFDMGGTSTDVSRIDEPPPLIASSRDGGEPPPAPPKRGLEGVEYQYETVKAGVRIMTPMLAVETVAAGGGSVCAFDGQKLTVGPHSAGADPGPACYGRGGPLTVTDMNVFLGRVVPDYFPFRLDRAIVARKLGILSEQIQRGADHNQQSAVWSPQTLDPVDLAEGFIKIANANMASAIKRISLAKGYDVREYALTTFGGAGAQHACAVAQTLGISRVLCSPFAGVLSAVGIGVADVKRIGQQSVNHPLPKGAVCLSDRKGPSTVAALDRVFESLTGGLEREMIDEGVDPAHLSPPVRTLDLCYAGQATLITVPAEPFERLAERFEALHQQLYGYSHEGRTIEIRVVRVELIAPSEHLSTRVTPHRTPPTHSPLSSSLSSSPPCVKGGMAGSASVPRTTTMVVDGTQRTVPLHLRHELSPGEHILGPAIVIEHTSTIIVDPGWEAAVIDTGDIVLTDVGASAPRPADGGCTTVEATYSTQPDPIQLELFNNQFVAVAEQMGTMLRRTALSVNVKERLDLSCALFTPEGDLVVNAPHIPVHLGGMSDCVKALMEDVGTFAPGDVYITNDPYRGGSHLNDVTVITPVHDADGRNILLFVASRAHHAEIGGTRPGSMPPDSRTLADEGVVIRAMRWIENGKAQHERLRALLTEARHPSRTPDENLADIAAQAAANQTGVRELRAMIARYGIDVVRGYTRHIQTAAERTMRKALSGLVDGIHRFEDRLDDGSPIRLAVTISGDQATFDFTGTGPVLQGNLNANRSIVTSAVLYCLRCLIAKDIPLNAGVLAPIEIMLPECLLNPPQHSDPTQCAAVVGGNVETSQRIVDCVFGALETVAAGQGTMNNLLIGNDKFGYYETICGGSGAGPGYDGVDAVHTHMTNTRLTDPEVLEARVPVRLIRFTIRRGSGGDGQYRGGCGVIRELEFLEPLDVSILSQRRTTAPYGLRGGENGLSGRNLLRRYGSDKQEVLPPIAYVAVQAGDRLIIETPGGGGWGKKTSKRQKVETSK